MQPLFSTEVYIAYSVTSTPLYRKSLMLNTKKVCFFKVAPKPAIGRVIDIAFNSGPSVCKWCYHTPPKAVVKEYGLFETDRNKPKNSERKLFQCHHFVHHECQMKSPRNEPGSQRLAV
jgi:hypothetical protein